MAAAGILLLLLFLVPATLYLAWVAISARKVETALAELRAAGEPTTVAELDSFYALPESVLDVAPLWLEAIRLLDQPGFREAVCEVPILSRELPEEEHEIPPPGEPWQRLEAAERFVDEYAEPLKLMHDAARAGGYARYPVDFSNLDSWRVSASWRCVCAMELEAHVRAHRGNWTGAVESIEAIFRLAGSLEYEPTLLAQLARMAWTRSGCELIQSLLPHADWNGDELSRLQAILEEIDNTEALVLGLQGDRVLSGIEVFRNPETLRKLGVDRPALLAWPGSHHDDLHCYLALIDREIAAASLPAPANFDATEAMKNEMAQMSASAGAMTRFRYAVTMTLWSPGTSTRIGIESDARNRTAAAAIACERFRRKHGRLPASLDGLVPEFLDAVPIDPFDGKPLRYAVRPSGFFVYSVGMNRIDDGGWDDEEDGPALGDLVFPVRRK